MTKKEKAIVLITAIAIIVLVIIVGALIWQGLPTEEERARGLKELEAEKEQKKQDALDATQRTQALIDEVKGITEKMKGLKEGSISKVTTIERNGVEGEEQVVIIAPGTSPISVEDGEVITIYGEEAQNQAIPSSSGAPRQSTPVDPEKLPPSTIRISITTDSVTPAEFSVKAGQVVFLAATAGSDSMETFSFADPSLRAVAIGLFAGETRAITFKAPDEKGEYVFFSNIPGHRDDGAEGKMVVE